MEKKLYSIPFLRTLYHSLANLSFIAVGKLSKNLPLISFNVIIKDILFEMFDSKVSSLYDQNFLFHTFFCTMKFLWENIISHDKSVDMLTKKIEKVLMLELYIRISLLDFVSFKRTHQDTNEY